MRDQPILPAQDAETLAIRALGFVAADSVLLNRFLALSGIDAADIRRAAGEPGFLAGVLGFIAAHEPTLLAFAADAGIDPGLVTRAMERLPSGSSAWDVSA